METAIKDPEDDGDENEAARQAVLDMSAQAFREKLTGAYPSHIIEEAIEQARQEMNDYTLARFMQDNIGEQDGRPEGYGKLNETYRWTPTEVPGVGTVIRAICLVHDKLMTTTLKVDPRYGRTQNKHTRGRQAVVYNGKPVLSWECRECSPVQWVVQ